MNPALLLSLKSTELSWFGWLPLAVFTAAVLTLHGLVPPWLLMWALAGVIYGGFKWWTWWRAISDGLPATSFRSCTYLLFWPGMDAERFLTANTQPERLRSLAWLGAGAKTLFGVALIWGVARIVPDPWGAGWVGMIGLIFLLHFGLFHLLALFWQRQGYDAPPLMRAPVLSDSLGDFWGRRWNSAFRDLAFGLLFLRLTKSFRARTALFLTFLFSGLIHELVITVPAGGGYGLPTLYFALQGTGMLVERSLLARKFKLRHTWRGRLFALAVVTLPICAAFPAPFVLRIMVPFFQFIHALP